MKILQPAGWTRPRGYSNGIAVPATGSLVFISGQIGVDSSFKLVSDDFAQQTMQALVNIVTILKEAGGGPEHIVRLTWYVTSKEEYQRSAKAVGEGYRSVLGQHYPAMTLVQVSGLLEKGARVEIEASAVIPI